MLWILHKRVFLDNIYSTKANRHHSSFSIYGNNFTSMRLTRHLRRPEPRVGEGDAVVPFPLTLDVPHRTTQAAIEEGRRIARGPAAKGG